MTVQSARPRDVGVANRKKNLGVVKEMPKNVLLKGKFLGMDDIHAIKFAKGTLTWSLYYPSLIYPLQEV
jgi:hypothetical protein